MDELQQIVNDSTPDPGKIGVVETRVTYIQENDTWGNVSQLQQMILATQGVGYSEDEGTDAFIRMKIGKIHPKEADICDFWSISGLEDLVRIFNDFQRRCGTNIRYKVTKIVTPEGKDPIIKEYE